MYILWTDYSSPIVRNSRKKWYWHLSLNLSVVPAWRIHCQLEKNNLSQLEFRTHIAIYLLKAKHKRMSGSSACLPAETRFDKQNHLLGLTTQGQ